MCHKYGFSGNVRWTIKCHLYVNPGKTIFIVFFTSVFILAFLVRLFELPFIQGHATILNDTRLYNYFNAIWLVIITVTSVGYGDIFPHTTPGKVIVMFVALYGAFLLSIIVLAVN